MPVLEGDLLNPKDPKIEDSDDWPLYTIRKAKVLSTETGEPVSLLTAHDDHPVTVLGTLEKVDSGLEGNTRDENYHTKTVQLDRVTNYAFAEYDDGTYGFWAAGKAGWFELKEPSPKYKQVLEGMNEAASMFYLLADKLRRSYKTNWTLSQKGLDRYAYNIFKDYLLHSKNCGRRVDVDDVREGFHQHSEYILTCMLEAQEGLDWQKAPIFNYFKNKFSGTFAEIEARMARNRGGEDPEADYEEHISPKSKKAGKVSSNEYQQTKRGTRQTQPRTPIKGKAEAIEISSNSSEEADDSTSSPQSTSRKRKSILQPKGSKYSQKATGRRQPSRSTNIDSTSDESGDAVLDYASPLATAAPRTTTSAAPPKKHSSVLDDYASHHQYLPRIIFEKKLVTYKLPSTEPQGPGDLWTCTFEGCRQRVHAGSTPEGKERIKNHFGEHAQAAQAKIDLALKESRPYLPVGNLVRRLQQFTALPGDLLGEEPRPADDSPDAATKKYPRRIKRSGY